MTEGINPITRTEVYLAKLCGAEVTIPEPVTRTDLYYAKLCGMDIDIPSPVTRGEMYLAKLCGMEVDIPSPVTRLEMYMAAACGLDIDIQTPEPITRIEQYWAIYLSTVAFTQEYTGALPIAITAHRQALLDYRIYGNSVQDGTPTPEEPVEVQSVGDLVIDEIDPNYGKYKIPVTVSGENGEETTADIYLDEPLRKIGDYADYVDFEKQQLIKNVAVVTFTGEEEWRVQGNAYFTYIAHTPSETPPALCSAFSLSTSGSAAVGEYRLAGIDSWNGNVLFNYDDGADGVDNFKSYLAQQYANGTPVKFYYLRVTPITELIEAPKIPTFAGTNVIDVDTAVKPSQMYVKGRVTPISTTDFSGIQTITRAGLAGKVFSIRDQLTCQRNGVNLVWDVIGIDHDTPADPQFTHSLTLQLHDCFLMSMQFDAPEAFYYAENGLAAGTYHFTVGNTYDTAHNDLTSYQFTLTQAVPAGGQLCFGWGYNTQASAAKVTSYANATSTTAIEKVAVSEGTEGTSLGALTAAGDFGNNLNSIHRVRYGSNNYKESAIRQWLNSDGAAGSVWAPQTDYDRPPSWVSNTAGFLNGMDADFLAVVGATHIVASRNAVCDGGGYDEMDDYFFLLSRSEIYGGAEVSGVNEGEPYPYYSDYSDLSAPGTRADSNRIKYRNGTAQYWWNRTPNSGNGNDARVVNTTGNVNNNANSSYGVAPACNII